MNYTEAFASFGASLTNKLWSCTAFAPNGDLVMAVFEPLLRYDKVTQTNKVDDFLHRYKWEGPARAEFVRHLDDALRNKRAIRCIVIYPPQSADIYGERGRAKDSEPKPEWVGELQVWDGDHYTITFKRDR